MNHETLNGFDAVWDRVLCADGSPAQGNTPETEEMRMGRFMDGEAQSEAAYRMLCRRWQQNRCGAVFSRIAREEAEHMTRLQAAYYLVTGDSYTPKKPEPVETSLPEALRAMWLGENAAASAYRTAAETAENPAIAEMYRCLAEDEARHAMDLFTMIRAFMV